MLLADPLVFLLQFDLLLRFIPLRIQLIQNTHVITRKPKGIGLSLAHAEQQRIFLQPLFRQNAQRTIIELNKSLIVGQRPLYFRYRDPLIAVDQIHFGIEPIGVTADEYPRLWLGCVETKTAKRFKAIDRRLEILHRIHEQEKPIVLQDLRTLQRQGVRIRLIHESGMQSLQSIDERLLDFTTTMNHQYFLPLRYDQLIPIRRSHFITQIRKTRLENQVFISLCEI